MSYEYANDITAYLEPIAVNDLLPSMSLYLSVGNYVLLPLEETYQSTLKGCPEPLLEMLNVHETRWD